MAPTPRSILAACRRQVLLRSACPAELPQVPGYEAKPIARTGGLETFDISHGILYGNPRRDVPPSFVHVVIEGGNLAHAYPFNLPVGGSTVPLTDALLTNNRTGPILVGRPRWGGKTGRLFLIPSFDVAPTIHSDHLMYVWKLAGIDRVISLHCWIPSSQTFRTLRSIVGSTR
jgi:hypothetical protein